MKIKNSRYLIAFVLPFLFPYSVLGNNPLAQQYLTEGNAYLTSGQFHNALNSFDAAIKQQPDNYMTYFKRATAYLGLGRNSNAIEDFTKILALKPGFDKALLQRARIYVNDGDFELATHDLEKYLIVKPNDKEAKELLSNTQDASNSLQQAQQARSNEKYDECISLASSVSRTAPLFARARLLRAQCHIAKGEIDEAAGDLARVTQLNPSDPTTSLLLSKINFYALGESQSAINQLKQCLHYDPEQKQCKTLFRRIKKLDKEVNAVEKDLELKKYATAANHLIGTANRQGLLPELETDFELLQSDLNMTGKTIPQKLHLKCYRLACKLYGEQKESDPEKINTWCSKTLEIEDDADAFAYRGKVLLDKKEFETAVKDLEKANELKEGRDGRTRQWLQQAQQMLKMSKKRDYYKILNVSHDADSREIKKAYRGKAHEWHPDKYNGELNKEEVERKMAEINQAYEVLSDPDMRQQYDNGFDPYDPEQGKAGPGQGGGFPFQQQGGFQFPNGFPFGGGGGAGSPFGGSHSFKMHF